MIALLAQLEFAAPGRLIVLVLLPALAWVALRGRRWRSLPQLASSTALRCLVVLLLCVAWAGPSCRRASQRQFVVFAVDESASCWADARENGRAFLKQARTAQGEHEARWIAFGSEPGRIESGVPALTGDDVDVVSPGTDITAVMNLAQAACPAGYVPRVVLLTDGLETLDSDGRARTSVLRDRVLSSAAAANVPISVVPLAAFSQPEIAIDAIAAPSDLASHEAGEVVVTIAANHADNVVVQLRREGEVIAQQPVAVADGLTEKRFTFSMESDSSAVLRAEVQGGDDTFAENNSLSTIVMPAESARVLIVGEQQPATEHLTSTLRKARFNVETTTPPRLAASQSELHDFRVIVLDDISASDLGPQRLAALDDYVRGGGGLIAVGGGNTFGAAAYELTALEKMLPVVATDQPVEQQKSLALVLVVDKSKSMEQENRLGLAKEAAKKVAAVLQQRDQVGVLAFGDETEWISRLAPLDNKDEVLARIDRLEASGLTNMVPALERAYLSLSQADADSRHVILLTDGVPTPGDFDEIAKKMAAAGITVSTVSLGKGADQTILADIARLARGVHHHVDNPSDLPKILEREAQTAASKVTDNEFTVQTYRQLPGLDVAGAPTITGYVATNYRPGAQLLLTAGEGDPLLAWWRYGRGEAMVLTTGLGEGAKQWQDWPGYAAFWKRLVTHAMRRRAAPPPAFSVTQRDGHITVKFDRRARSHRPIALEDGMVPITVARYTDDAPIGRVVMMSRVQPDMFEAIFDAQPGEVITFTLGRFLEERADNPRADLAFYVPYPEEFRLRPADERKLETIASTTGGEFNPSPELSFEPDGRTVDVVHPLWPIVLIAALLAYLADVAIRRRDVLVRPNLPARPQE